MRSRLAIVTAVATGVALLLAGCGTAEDPLASSATASDAGATRPSIPEPIPDPVTDGGTFDDPGNDGVACPEGLTRCGDRCVDLMVSGGNCGVCGAHCPMSMQCEQGQCVDR